MYRGDLTRVLNIETKSKLISSWKAHLLASTGSNMDSKNDRGKFRKGLGLTTNFFSEKFFYSQVMYFTIISTENQIISKMFFPFPILVVLTTKRLMQIWLRNASWDTENGTYGTFRAFYTFGYNRDNTNTRSEQHYFPSNNYQQRLYEEQNSNSDRKQNPLFRIFFLQFK